MHDDSQHSAFRVFHCHEASFFKKIILFSSKKKKEKKIFYPCSYLSSPRVSTYLNYIKNSEKKFKSRPFAAIKPCVSSMGCRLTWLVDV